MRIQPTQVWCYKGGKQRGKRTRLMELSRIKQQTTYKCTIRAFLFFSIFI